MKELPNNFWNWIRWNPKISRFPLLKNFLRKIYQCFCKMRIYIISIPEALWRQQTWFRRSVIIKLGSKYSCWQWKIKHIRSTTLAAFIVGGEDLKKRLKKYQCRWTEEVLTNCFKVIQNSRDIFAVFIAKFSVDHSRIYFEGVIYIYYRNL